VRLSKNFYRSRIIATGREGGEEEVPGHFMKSNNLKRLFNKSIVILISKMDTQMVILCSV
jgi:hypothetical protein